MITNYVRDEVLFDLSDEEIEALRKLREGGTTPTPTPSPSKRVRQFPDGKWYVIDSAGKPVSPGYRTQAMAVNAAEFTYPATPTPSLQSAGGVTGTADQAQGIVDKLLPFNLNIDLPAGGGSDPVGPAGRTASQVRSASVAGQGYASEAERQWYLSLPVSVRAAIEGGGGVGGTAGAASASGTSTATAKVSGNYGGLTEAELKQLYFSNKLTREELAAQLQANNPKMSPNAIETRIALWEEAQPKPKNPTRADILGPQGANLAAQWNPRAEGFGDTVNAGTSSGLNFNFENMFGPGTGGTGGIVAFDQFGRPELSHLSLGGQQMAATDSTPNSILGTSVQDILAQRGIKPTGNPVSDAELLSQSLATQATLAEQFPGASPSDINRMQIMGLTGMDPATRRVNPATGNYADLDTTLQPIQPFREGGTVRALLPTPDQGYRVSSPDSETPASPSRLHYGNDDSNRPYLTREESDAMRALRAQRQQLNEANQAVRGAAQDVVDAAGKEYAWDALNYRYGIAGLPTATKVMLPEGANVNPVPGVRTVSMLPELQRQLLFATNPMDALAIADQIRSMREGGWPNFQMPGGAIGGAAPQPELTPGQTRASMLAGGTRSFANGGSMMAPEEIWGVGRFTGKPYFRLGEGLPFAGGNPEVLTITPVRSKTAMLPERIMASAA